MVPQIPYAAIGIGIAVLLGVWAFVIAETVRARAVIVAVPVLVFLVPVLFRSRAGHLISLIGFMIYGLGCLIYLRWAGVGVR